MAPAPGAQLEQILAVPGQGKGDSQGAEASARNRRILQLDDAWARGASSERASPPQARAKRGTARFWPEERRLDRQPDKADTQALVHTRQAAALGGHDPRRLTEGVQSEGGWLRLRPDADRPTPVSKHTTTYNTTHTDTDQSDTTTVAVSAPPVRSQGLEDSALAAGWGAGGRSGAVGVGGKLSAGVLGRARDDLRRGGRLC